MLSLFIFCFTINLSVSASGGGRGTYEDDNHNTEVIDGNYRKADELGGYGGQVDVHYDVNGQVQYNGQTIDVNVTLESYTKYMDLHSLGLYDPRNDLSSLYTYGGMGPNAELWAKLAADTGIGTAAD